MPLAKGVRPREKRDDVDRVKKRRASGSGTGRGTVNAVAVKLQLEAANAAGDWNAALWLCLRLSTDLLVSSISISAR